MEYTEFGAYDRAVCYILISVLVLRQRDGYPHNPATHERAILRYLQSGIAGEYTLPMHRTLRDLSLRTLGLFLRELRTVPIGQRGASVCITANEVSLRLADLRRRRQPIITGRRPVRRCFLALKHLGVVLSSPLVPLLPIRSSAGLLLQLQGEASESPQGTTHKSLVSSLGTRYGMLSL